MLASLHPVKKYFLTMFMVSCVLLEAFTLVIYHQSRNTQQSNDWVIHSYEALRIARLALADASDLATQEQDYLLTGNFSYLSTYRETAADLNKNLNALGKETADNPEQQKNAALLSERYKRLEKISAAHLDTLQARRSNIRSLKASIAETRQATSALREAFDVFSAHETQLLDTRRAAAHIEYKNYLWTLFMGGALGLGALIIANLAILMLIAGTTRAEEKLRKTENLFSVVLTGINDGIFDYKPMKNAIEYSASYEALLGYKGKELGASLQDILALVHPDDIENVRDVFELYRTHQIDSYTNVFRLRHKDGHWVWVLSRGVGIWDDDGKLQRLIGAHTDISVQKQREEELHYFIKENEKQQKELIEAKEKAEAANLSKSDFLAAMSHEIRTPLNAVIGLAQLLLKMPLGAKQLEMAETLEINADILLHLVNDQLDISRIEAGQLELESRAFTFTPVFRTLHALFDDHIKAKGLKLSIADSMDKNIFIGDRTRIQQILVNLVGNAVKFTTHGSITVTSEYKNMENGQADIHINVIDTGIGISPKNLPTIFGKFVQADKTILHRYGGSGLGLSLCKSMAQLMGGDIAVTSVPGQGSVFTFTLSLKIEEKTPRSVAQIPARALTRAVAGEGEVLIVEDYSPNIMVATMMLENLGYSVDVARSGEAAVAKIRAKETPYAAILMDIQMQDMDGLETTAHIRALEKEKEFCHFIIGLTAHALAGDRERCLKAGMDDYMSKPIHPDLLEQKLNFFLKAA